MAARIVGSVVLAIVVIASWALGIGALTAQEPAESTGWLPPLTSDGQPDIQGIWGSADSGMFSLNIEPRDHLVSFGMPQSGGFIQSSSGHVQMPSAKTTLVVDPPSGILPHQPWALERRNSVMRSYVNPDPWQMDGQTPGWPNGVPRKSRL